MKKLTRNITVFVLLILFPICISASFSEGCSNKQSQSEIKEERIEGLYVLESCEKSRFKVRIDRKGNNYFYSILDKAKIISKGKAIITKDEETYIQFGKIEGVYSENKIVIQNYGNSMNKYTHFTQCDQKYLSFNKK